MLIFVYGPETFTAKARVDEMRRKFQEKFDPSGLNRAEFPSANNEKVTLEAVAQAVTAPPFLGERRLVIVRGVIEGLKKADAEKWAPILAKIPSTTITVFWESMSVAMFEKHPLVKMLAGTPDMHLYAHAELEASQLSAWARAYAKSVGLVIEPRLLDEVVSMVGGDLWHLSNELQKLSAAGNGQPVTKEMVVDLVRANFDDRMFAFLDAVSAKNQRETIRLLNEERQTGAEDMYLLSMLFRQIKLLLGAREVIEVNARATSGDVATALGVHPFVAQKTLGAARSFKRDELRALHTRAFEADSAVKRGLSPALAVDRLVAAFLGI